MLTLKGLTRQTNQWSNQQEKTGIEYDMKRTNRIYSLIILSSIDLPQSQKFCLMLLPRG